MKKYIKIFSVLVRLSAHDQAPYLRRFNNGEYEYLISAILNPEHTICKVSITVSGGNYNIGSFTYVHANDRNDPSDISIYIENQLINGLLFSDEII